MFGTIPEFNQSLDMFKTMWGQNAAGQMPGQFPFTTDASKVASGFSSAFPGLDVDELEKRIKDLKTLEDISHEISLEDSIKYADKLMAGDVRGRFIVDVNK